MAVAAVAGAIAALVWAPTHSHDWVIYNHSPSIPTGLYIRQTVPVAHGSIVTVRAVDVAPVEATARHFTDDDDRFIKRVAAITGDAVCADGDEVRVNGDTVSHRRTSDGRAPSAWNGCRILAPDELFLLGDTEDSFDSRYWGPTTRDKIEGVWVPLAF